MGDLLNSVWLGIVEGLTEFIPVSSTAHLLVAERFLKLTGEHWDVFTVVIQLGAILAVVAIYWRKFWDVLVGLPRSADARRFALAILIAFIPSVIGGILLKKWIDRVLLDPAAPRPRHLDGDRLPLTTAFWIGMFQVLSILFPGTSRSGATILGG